MARVPQQAGEPHRFAPGAPVALICETPHLHFFGADGVRLVTEAFPSALLTAA